MAARADLDQVCAAAGSVIDPEIGRPLADLGMIGPASVGRGGRVRLQLRLTTKNCPHSADLQSALREAVGEVDGVRDVELDVVAMPARERVELGERLLSTTAPITGSLGIGGTKVYAVASGKGGVGKSTVTANLAAALAATGKRVGVLDADVWGYSIPQIFGVRRPPVVLGELMLPVPAHGVALMSIGFFVNEEQPVVWRGPMLHKALQQFVADTYWGTLDALFVDLPPGTGDATLSLLDVLPDTALLVVTTPQTAAQTVATRVARMASNTGVPILGVIENMSAAVCANCSATTAVFGTGGGLQLAEDAAAPLLGQVPLDLALREAGDRGVPVVVGEPTSASAQELARIATSLPTPRRKFAGKALPLAVVGSR